MIKTTDDIDVKILENYMEVTVAKLEKSHSELQKQLKRVCAELEKLEKKESLSPETKTLVMCVKILFDGIGVLENQSNMNADMLRFAVKVVKVFDEVQKTFGLIIPELQKLPNVQEQVVQLKNRFEVTFGDLETTIHNIRNKDEENKNKTENEKNLGDMSFIG